MKYNSQDMFNVASSFNDKLISVNGFSCLDEKLEIAKLLNLGKDFRICITKDLEQELLSQEPGGRIESITNVASPEYQTKANTRRNDPVDVTEYLKAIFHLEVIIYSSSGEKWCLTIDLSYARQPSYTSDVKYQIKQDMIILVSKLIN